ncbi:MAG: hypothetical protein LLG04_08590 [Parachlamydia sp.]|nr:hypothetical protein [Parachlamydia sp.]
MQSAQNFLNYLLNFTEQEKILIPYLGALSQHSGYRNLKALQQFFATVADALQYLQEPIEKTRLYQNKLKTLEDLVTTATKGPITTALINAFRKGANLAPLDQLQTAPAAQKGLSHNLQARLAMVRNLAAKPEPVILAPPAAKAPEAKKTPLNPSLPPPPPPTPQVKHTIAKPPIAAIAPPVQPLKPPVQAMQHRFTHLLLKPCSLSSFLLSLQRLPNLLNLVSRLRE